MSQTEFRGLLKHLDQIRLLRHVSRPVDARHELVSIMRKVQKCSNEPLLFNAVTGSPTAVATNVLCRRSILADALGLNLATLLPDLIKREGQTRPLDVVTDAPVHERVVTENIRVEDEIPQIVHCQEDAGPYITAGVCIARHPESGIHNASWNRIQIVGGDHMRIRMMAPQHLGQYQAAAERENKALPALMLSAASKIPFEADELLTAGGWQETPLRVVQAKTVPLLVPADAEYVIEGYVPPHVMEEEGPFGEFTDGYVAKAPNNVMQVTAVTRRNDAIYHVILAGGTEDSTLLGVPLQTEVYKRVSAFGKIRDIGTPGHIFGCVVSLEKTSDEQARAVMLAALAAHAWMKVVIVVDADVDPHDANEVMWAVHTRHTPETGAYVIPHLGSFQRADVRDAHRGKIGIDATAPMKMRDVFRRRQFPGIDTLDLEAVLDPLRPVPDFQ
jgi:UbiD family decarboxylase